MIVHGIKVKGIDLDHNTRCTHYSTEKDIIAIKFKCCDTYYPCSLCHAEIADHSSETWSREQHDVKAILCGSCGNELTIKEYLACKFACPHCQNAFNSGCQLHYEHYFEL